MKYTLAQFTLVVLFTFIRCSSTNESFVPPVLQLGLAESVGLSSERLDRIDQLFQQSIDSNYVQGIAGMIIRNGKIAYYKSFGHRDENEQAPLSNDAIYRIASQTKAITSLAVMMLFEEGKFLLDDPISKYLPEFSDPQVMTEFHKEDSSYASIPASRPITIRQLLTHTSGMSYFGFGDKSLRSVYAKNGLPSVFGSDQNLLKDFSKTAGKMPLLHEPGEKFTYGINTDILGRLVEVISGLSLNEFFTSRIFEPLGMNDTYFYLPQEKANRLTPVFTKENGKLVEYHGLDGYGVGLDYPVSEGTFYGGGAGLSSTMMDYAIFLQMLLNGGEYNGKRLISRRTVDLMTCNQVGDLDIRGNKFGLGFLIITREGQTNLGQTEGSFEWGGYYGTKYWADPKEQLIGLLFTNQRGIMPGSLHDKFKVLTYAALID
ncbi:serine hydrolase [Marinoscillum sp. MHG1-6]|uniref:serine hydrolase domain-containing protein n=1 Tax=Marinoscillum sp. MHG1-6 TaxID=2959627 RepID=UPI0021580D6B|nr:serine hydrolase domain-containing protein [Marinoscillum sp. MHG1-6]